MYTLHYHPNTDNTHHTYVTTSDCQRILITTPRTTATTKLTTTTTTQVQRIVATAPQPPQPPPATPVPPPTTQYSIMAQMTQVASFGPMVNFFIFLFVFFYTKHYWQLLLIYGSYGGAQGRQRQGERSQTTCFTSFGPFFYSNRVYFLY